MRRIALVTGAASGLGLATAQRLASEGDLIALADKRVEGLQAVADSLAGDGHFALSMDVANAASVEVGFALIETRVGPIGVVCHFAGILNASGSFGRVGVEGTSVEDWEGIFAVNARGAFLVTREMARRRRQHPVANARIILAASQAGQMGALQGSAAYAATKGAVIALTKSAAREFAPLGITVNAIAPGPIDTPMMRQSISSSTGSDQYGSLSAIPLGRVGKVEEVAAAAAYLASADAGFVTGATIDVNGGAFMR